MITKASSTAPEQAGANLGQLEQLIRAAQQAGADGVEAMLAVNTTLSVSQRLGQLEQLERAEHHHLGLVVLLGQRRVIVSGAVGLDSQLLVERAMAMVRAVPEDPYCGLAAPALLASDFPDLDSEDPFEPNANDLSELARETEESARAVSGVTNSDGCEASWQRSSFTLLSSNGFLGTYRSSRWGLSAVALSGSGVAMERDYEFSSAIHKQDLLAASDVGRSAGERSVRRLGARRVKSGVAPIIYEPRVSRSLLGHLASAINGRAIASGSSFLKRDDIGQAIFSPEIQIIDDPLIRRGLRSRAFDAEGLPVQRLAIVENGILKHWLLDLHSASRLDLRNNNRATRSVNSLPSPAPSNLFLRASNPRANSRQDLFSEVEAGLLVSDLIGHGINPATGDYSRGVAGFWIERGEITFPVSEVTISGNLRQMFGQLEAADDLDLRFGIDAPSIRIDSMIIAGD